MEKMMNLDEAREFLGGISRMTLYRWREEGMPYYKVGRRCLYSQEKITEWLEEREVRENAEEN